VRRRFLARTVRRSKINRSKDGCAGFRGVTELHRNAAEDQGGGSVDKATRLMPTVVVMPGQCDEAKGDSRPSKDMTAEVRTRR
jgi:hypothetical protein